MIICKIWDVDYPWDIRVEKVANSIVVEGQDVHLVCQNQSCHKSHAEGLGLRKQNALLSLLTVRVL